MHNGKTRLCAAISIASSSAKAFKIVGSLPRYVFIQLVCRQVVVWHGGTVWEQQQSVKRADIQLCRVSSQRFQAFEDQNYIFTGRRYRNIMPIQEVLALRVTTMRPRLTMICFKSVHYSVGQLQNRCSSPRKSYLASPGFQGANLLRFSFIDALYSLLLLAG